jgi:uncharacterized protein
MRRAFLGLAVLLLLPAACGAEEPSVERAAPSAPRPTLSADLLTLFHYDSSAPVAAKEKSVQARDGAAVHDISYAGPNGRVSAYLVVPQGTGPFPAVVLMHGSDGYRVSFLGEALALAKGVIVSLLPDAPYVREPHPPLLTFTPGDSEQFVQTVVELRRGVDLLVAREEIDPTRLAYVGYSWGGNLGFLLAAVERRVRSLVLISGVPGVGADLATLPDAQALDPAALAAYLKTWEPLAGMHYVRQAASSALYIQAGRLDEAPAPNESRQLFVTASEPKKLQLYDAGHELDEHARSDRAAWLAQRFTAS